MMNSPATILNEDVIQEILSHCPATEVGKFRLLNKACNKRSYELASIKRHLHKTNSVFGYFVHYKEKWCSYRARFVSGVEEEEDDEKPRISLMFLPSYSAEIQAWDTHHGILLCIDDDKYKGAKKIPDYIVCKPATKEYRIIPNPKTRYKTITTGLMVVSSNPFRYKILRVSDPRKWMTKNGFYNHNCEVFDSDTFKWKKLDTFVLPEYYLSSAKPVSAYGCLHWLMGQINVLRFCMQTETWSIFPVPDKLSSDNFMILVSYEGKLGVIDSRIKSEAELWVLESSFSKSWVKVKNANFTALKDEYVEPVWFPSNDVVSVVGSDLLGLYNMNNNSCHKKNIFFPYYHFPRKYIVPFYSNYDRVGLKKKNDIENKKIDKE